MAARRRHRAERRLGGREQCCLKGATDLRGSSVEVIWPRLGFRASIIPGYDLSPIYFAEEITGMVFVIPFVVFAVAPVLRSITQTRAGAFTETARANNRWLTASLGSAFLSGVALFLVFFWATERYFLDFVPPALALSVMGFWQLIESARTRPFVRAGIIMVGLCLIAMSVLVSNLTAIGYNAAGFRSLNPVLWMQLNNVFRP